MHFRFAPRPVTGGDADEIQSMIDGAYAAAMLMGVEASWHYGSAPGERAHSYPEPGVPKWEQAEFSVRMRNARRMAEIDAAWEAHRGPTKMSYRQLKESDQRNYANKAIQSEAQNHRCCYCGIRFSDDPRSESFATWEHVLPRARGGSDTLKNLVLACHACNAGREDEMWPEHYEALETAGRPYLPTY
jgi:5-methylcytosine-specific restriction endonuclease McrA